MTHARRLMSMAKAADELDIGVKTLRGHCDAGEIRFVRVGKRTRKFTPGDLEEFIESRRAECPSTDRKTRRTGTLTSNSRVYDFMALREQRTSQRQGK